MKPSILDYTPDIPEALMPKDYRIMTNEAIIDDVNYSSYKAARSAGAVEQNADFEIRWQEEKRIRAEFEKQITDGLTRYNKDLKVWEASCKQ